MCCNTFKIKPVNPTASNRIFCQCGICEDCRKAERSHWSFRLQAEMLGRQKQGWKCGFFTLTYDDEHLPQYLIDEEYFDSESKERATSKEPWTSDHYTTFPCFSRSDIRTFILRLRKYLWKHYQIKGISYMICCEYGDNTQRPHYHGIISWPPVIDAIEMHRLIRDFWTDKGFIIPKDPLGGFDRHGLRHLPFEVENLVYAAKYCAKYVCKDIGFWHDAIEAGIDSKDRKFRKEYAPFHIQNRGLGQQFLYDLSERQKVDLLINGFAFVGSDVLLSCPVYLRNKIIFDTHYVYNINTRNRLVRRQASDFFERHKDEIYRAKLKTYTELFSRIQSDEYMFNRVSDHFASVYEKCANTLATWQDFADEFQQNIDIARSWSPEVLARYYLSYYKVPIHYRLRDPVQSWFNHYTQFYESTDLPQIFEVSSFDDVISSTLILMQAVHNPIAADKALVDLVADYHKHME